MSSQVEKYSLSIFVCIGYLDVPITVEQLGKGGRGHVTPIVFILIGNNRKLRINRDLSCNPLSMYTIHQL